MPKVTNFLSSKIDETFFGDHSFTLIGTRNHLFTDQQLTFRRLSLISSLLFTCFCSTFQSIFTDYPLIINWLSTDLSLSIDWLFIDFSLSDYWIFTDSCFPFHRLFIVFTILCFVVGDLPRTGNTQVFLINKFFGGMPSWVSDIHSFCFLDISDYM